MNYRLFKKYNIVYGEGVKTPEGRFSWVHLTTKKDPMPPKAGEQPGKPKYEVTLLLPKSDKMVKNFVKELEGHVEKMLPIYNENAQNEVSKVKRILKDGDKSDHEKAPQEKGMWILTARNPELPRIVDRKVNDLTPQDILAGMSGHFVVVPSLSSGGLGFKLEVIQLIEDDGTRFGGTKQDYSSLLGEGEEEEAEETEEEEEETEEVDEDEDESDDEEEEESDDDDDEEEEEDDEDEEEEEEVKPAPQKAKPMDMRAKLASKVKEKSKSPAQMSAGKGKKAAVSLLS